MHACRRCGVRFRHRTEQTGTLCQDCNVQFHPRISEKLEETCGKKIQIVKCQTKELLLLACDLRKLHPGRHRAKFSW